MDIGDFHKTIIRETFSQDLSDEDAFGVFGILHTYLFVAEPGYLREDAVAIMAETQRGAAMDLASLWEGTSDVRADYYHWYYLWNTKWECYSHWENLDPEEKVRIRSLRERIESHPAVRMLIVDEGESDPLE